MRASLNSAVNIYMFQATILSVSGTHVQGKGKCKNLLLLQSS